LDLSQQLRAGRKEVKDRHRCLPLDDCNHKIVRPVLGLEPSRAFLCFVPPQDYSIRKVVITCSVTAHRPVLFTQSSRLDRYPTILSEPVTWRSSLGLRLDHPSGGAHWDHWGLAPACKTTDTSAGL